MRISDWSSDVCSSDLREFDSLGTSPFSLELETGVGKQGAIQANGQLQMSPVSGKLAVTTRDIDLRIAQAYLSPLVHLEVRSGLLRSEERRVGKECGSTCSSRGSPDQ